MATQALSRPRPAAMPSNSATLSSSTQTYWRLLAPESSCLHADLVAGWPRPIYADLLAPVHARPRRLGGGKIASKRHADLVAHPHQMDSLRFNGLRNASRRLGGATTQTWWRTPLFCTQTYWRSSRRLTGANCADLVAPYIEQNIAEHLRTLYYRKESESQNRAF